MHIPILLAIAVAIGTAVSSPTSRPHILHERRESVPVYWQKGSRAAPDARLYVRIGLAQRNLHLVPHYLEEVSNPTSPSYGKHWTAEQIIDFFSPLDESIESVRAWLRQAGINEDRQSLTPKRGWIWFEAQVAEVEALLLSESCGNRDEYSIPASLRPHIDLIIPTIDFPENQKEDTPRQLPRASFAKQAVLGAPASLDVEASTIIDSSLTTLAYCANVMTPDCIRGVFILEAIPLVHLLTLLSQ